MSKTKFIEVVENLFEIHPVDAKAREYFEKVLKAKRVNKKEIEKSDSVKNAILELLSKESPKTLDRTQIAEIIYNSADLPESYLLNDKGTIAYNSITAYANQLVTNGLLAKKEVRIGKTKKVVYSTI